MADRLSNHARLRAALRASCDPHLSSLADCALRHGWGLSGPGYARFGWHAVYTSGGSRYLGPSVGAVESTCATARGPLSDLWPTVRQEVARG